MNPFNLPSRRHCLALAIAGVWPAWVSAQSSPNPIKLIVPFTPGTGIDIVARPPGKRNSTISQLSGGEKALTAVALVLTGIADYRSLNNAAPVATLRERVFQVFGSQVLEDLLDLGDHSRNLAIPIEPEEAPLTRHFRLRGHGPEEWAGLVLLCRAGTPSVVYTEKPLRRA